MASLLRGRPSPHPVGSLVYLLTVFPSWQQRGSFFGSSSLLQYLASVQYPSLSDDPKVVASSAQGHEKQ
jgi:hypothetical protein